MSHIELIFTENRVVATIGFFPFTTLATAALDSGDAIQKIASVLANPDVMALTIDFATEAFMAAQQFFCHVAAALKGRAPFEAVQIPLGRWTPSLIGDGVEAAASLQPKFFCVAFLALDGSQKLSDWLESPGCSLISVEVHTDCYSKIVRQGLSRNFSLREASICGISDCANIIKENAEKRKKLTGRCVRATIVLLGCKHRSPLFRSMPKDIVLMLARLVMQNKRNDVWLDLDRPQRLTKNSLTRKYK